MTNEASRPRQPGETVVLRYLTRDGRPGMCWPAFAVEDRDDLLALWIPEGATYKQWRLQRPATDAPEGTPPARTIVDGAWRRDTLRLMFPGAHHSVWLSWDRTESGRDFHGYYVNLEEPYRRTSIGFDTNDHALDVVVSPDLTWTWKDEDELERRRETGIYHPDFVDSIRAEGERAIAILEERRFPFTGDYVDWLPEPTWGIPDLLEGWDTAPPALWPDRFKAYGDASTPRA